MCSGLLRDQTEAASKKRDFVPAVKVVGDGDDDTMTMKTVYTARFYSEIHIIQGKIARYNWLKLSNVFRDATGKM